MRLPVHFGGPAGPRGRKIAPRGRVRGRLGGIALAPLLAGVLTLVSHQPVGAAGGMRSVSGQALEQSAPYGRVTLYATPTVAATVATYTTCKPVRRHQTDRAMTSFQHLPLAGCQAVLVRKAQRFVLCAGQGTIPPDFRVAPLLQIQPGSTPACRSPQ